MAAFFFYGTLRHAALLHAVMGRPVSGRPARLAGHVVRWAEGESFPVILAEPGAVADGLLVENLGEDDIARLDFYEGGFAYHAREVAVDAGDGPVEAQIFFADPTLWKPGAPWHLADWAAIWGDVVAAAATDFMRLYGQKPSDEVLRRYYAMLVRASSTVRAADAAPSTVRRAAAPGDVALQAYRQPYAEFFAVEEFDLSFRRFDGTMSETVTRAAFITGDAAIVLPYDPVRDRVLVIEQFRMGPYSRGDAQPWMLEPVAGRIDPGETPEDCALREAVEEAGVTLTALVPGPRCYPSPGAKSEYHYSYIGLADLPDDAAGLGGVADEAEDIRGHLIPFARLMDLVETGEAENAPLILLAWFLARERDRLRAEAGAA